MMLSWGKWPIRHISVAFSIWASNFKIFKGFAFRSISRTTGCHTIVYRFQMPQEMRSYFELDTASGAPRIYYRVAITSCGSKNAPHHPRHMEYTVHGRRWFYKTASRNMKFKNVGVCYPYRYDSYMCKISHFHRGSSNLQYNGHGSPWFWKRFRKRLLWKSWYLIHKLM